MQRRAGAWYEPQRHPVWLEPVGRLLCRHRVDHRWAGCVSCARAWSPEAACLTPQCLADNLYASAVHRLGVAPPFFKCATRCRCARLRLRLRLTGQAPAGRAGATCPWSTSTRTPSTSRAGPPSTLTCRRAPGAAAAAPVLLHAIGPYTTLPTPAAAGVQGLPCAPDAGCLQPSQLRLPGRSWECCGLHHMPPCRRWTGRSCARARWPGRARSGSSCRAHSGAGLPGLPRGSAQQRTLAMPASAALHVPSSAGRSPCCWPSCRRAACWARCAS